MSHAARLARIVLAAAILAVALTVSAQEPATNPIDAYFAKAAKAGKRPAGLDDRRFLRKMWLDIAGVHPSFEAAQAYVADGRPDKRVRAVEQALASQDFVYRWANYFGDMFWTQLLVPNAPTRNAFHQKLVAMLADNTPWDEMARRILTDRGLLTREGSAGNFWLVETLDDDFRLDQVDDQAAFITEAFLGVQTRCISCHDGAGHLEKINVDLTARTRREFWGLAAFLAGQALYFPNPRANVDGMDVIYEIEIVDVDDPGFNAGFGAVLFHPRGYPVGEYRAESEDGQGMRPARKGGIVEPVYPFTGERPQPGETRREALARILTADRQFARNMVNRVWKHFFGKGFVDPVDEWDLARLDMATAAQNQTTVQPQDGLLLELLTDHFIDSGYDLKELMRAIVHSGHYQAVSGPLAAPATRRLEAEALLDGVAKLSGVQLPYLAFGMLDRLQYNLWAMPGTIEPNPAAIFSYERDMLADPTELGYPSLDVYYAIQALTLQMLQSMGRGDRINRIRRSDEFDMQSSLALMNNPLLTFQLLGNDQGPGPVAATLTRALQSGAKTVDDAVRELYLRALFREPDAAELAAGRDYLAADQSQSGVADLMWSLVNHPEFAHK